MKKEVETHRQEIRKDFEDAFQEQKEAYASSLAELQKKLESLQAVLASYPPAAQPPSSAQQRIDRLLAPRRHER